MKLNPPLGINATTFIGSNGVVYTLGSDGLLDIGNDDPSTFYQRGFSANELGATGSRPAIGVSDGDMFFDSTLGKPIWRLKSSNTGWIDATGTQA